MTPRENAQNLVALVRQARPGTAGRLLLYAAAYAVRRATGWSLYHGGLFSFSFGRFHVASGRGDLGTIGEIFVNRPYQVAGFIPSDGDVCLDIGANIGCVSRQWRLTNPTGRIIAVEPHPETVQVLRKNCLLNSGDDITVVHAAVGSRVGPAELVIDRNHSSMARPAATNLRALGGFAAEERVTVVGVTLDSLLATYALPRVDLLKIDVEGFEVECLNGGRAALGVTERAIVEFHSDELRARCRGILDEAGFHVQEHGTLLFAQRGRAAA